MRSAMILIGLAIAFMLTVTGCTDLGTSPPPDDVTRGTGTVVQKSTAFFVIEADNPIGSFQVRIVHPVNLPDAFKTDQLRVRFSGRIEADPLTMYVYAPLRITFIEHLLP